MDEVITPADANGTENSNEDDRRQKAAEINRKRVEEQWNRNKEQWIQDNFPEKRNPG